uniref:Protein KTI12 homolog n=1 Tax=Branchiostoma floridae TaxID=7739 RepID=C3YDP1_BRAFL|eukprot:XP_002605500.1 hypothetical protein BRAFLDRAFT_126804 [Branchiostoma floridae]
MPLVVLCGIPCCGKSRRVEELKNHIESTTDRPVHVVSDESVGIDKNAVYADSRQEKDARAKLKSVTEKKLTKETVVILDSLNYIKGYRYELFCLIKLLQTPHCVIHCDINPPVASQWNQEREPSEQYTQEIFDGLVMRFEAPDSRHRWDSPLFTIQTADELPCQDICDAIFHRKAPPPNASTQTQPLSSTNFLHELDKITQEVVNTLLDAQKTAVPGDYIYIPGAADKISFPAYIYLSHVVSAPELRRHRRQFITYTKMHPVDDTSKLANMFVQYLNNSIK